MSFSLGVVMRFDKTYEVIDHTADMGIIAYGTDLKQLFANAAGGMFDQMVNLDVVTESVTRTIKLTSDDTESLLVEWLNELLYIFDTEYLVFKRYDISVLNSGTLKAICYGDKLDFKANPPIREIKAATYHMLSIASNKEVFKAQIIFDI